MPKLRVLSGRQVCAILATHGFAEVRQRGSHVVMQKRSEGTTITVPVPDHAELRIGTDSTHPLWPDRTGPARPLACRQRRFLVP